MPGHRRRIYSVEIQFVSRPRHTDVFVVLSADGFQGLFFFYIFPATSFEGLSASRADGGYRSARIVVRVCEPPVDTRMRNRVAEDCASV